MTVSGGIVVGVGRFLEIVGLEGGFLGRVFLG